MGRRVRPVAFLNAIIFRMVGAEGHSLNSTKKALDREGVPTPKGSRSWGNTFIQRVITDDVYKPHTFEEVGALVLPEVASALDSAKCYGIWWFNRRRRIEKQVSQASREGRRYIRRSTITEKPREEWIAVPVPNAGIPREWVDAARVAISENAKFSHAGGRYWELSGLMRCSRCGCRMLGNSSTTGSKNKTYHHYRCRTRHLNGKGACSMSRNIRAGEAEQAVWSFISNLLLNPGALRESFDEMMGRESAGNHGNPDTEAAVWLDRLADVERKRSSFQDMAAERLITFDELRSKLATLEETGQTARRELAVLEGRTERLRALERDRETLLQTYAEMIPEALSALEPEERHRVYNMLRLRTVAFPDGTLEVSGALREELLVCKSETRGHVLEVRGSQGRGGRSWAGHRVHRRRKNTPQRQRHPAQRRLHLAH
jgi:site-specific DNA recombinase